MAKWTNSFFVLVFIVLASVAYADSGMTVESIKNAIVGELPIGSSKEQIMAFIKAHQLASDTSTGEGYYAPKTNAVFALVRNARWSLESFLGFRTDIQLIFYLDNEEKLKNYTVEEVHTWF